MIKRRPLQRSQRTVAKDAPSSNHVKALPDADGLAIRHSGDEGRSAFLRPQRVDETGLNRECNALTAAPSRGLCERNHTTSCSPTQSLSFRSHGRRQPRRLEVAFQQDRWDVRAHIHGRASLREDAYARQRHQLTVARPEVAHSFRTAHLCRLDTGSWTLNPLLHTENSCTLTNTTRAWRVC